MTGGERVRHQPQRERGEGGLFQVQLRGRTRWRATEVVTVTVTENGEEKRKKRTLTGTGDTPAEARQRLRESVRRFWTLTPTQQVANRRTNLTVERYYRETWLNSRRVREYRPHVRRGIRQRLEMHVLDAFGSTNLGELRKDAIVHHFHQTLPQKGLAESTRLNVWKNFGLLLNDAVYDEKLASNPMELVRASDRPQKARPAAFHIPPQLVTTVQESIKGTDIEALRMMQLFLGMRISEVLGLTWDRVHLHDEGRVLEVRQQLAKIDVPHGDGCRRNRETGKWGCGKIGRNCPHHGDEKPTEVGVHLVPYTKGEPRNVTLVEPMLTLLRQQKERQKQWKQQESWNPIDRPGMENLVFTTPEGQPFRQQKMNREWKQLLTDCGFEEQVQHSTRKIAVTALILNGTPLSIIGSIVGHADSRITEQVYAQINWEDQRVHLERTGQEYDRDVVAQRAVQQEQEWRASREKRVARAAATRDVEVLENARAKAVEDAAYALENQGRSTAAFRLREVFASRRAGRDRTWADAVEFAAQHDYELAVTEEELASYGQLFDAMAELEAHMGA